MIVDERALNSLIDEFLRRDRSCCCGDQMPCARGLSEAIDIATLSVGADGRRHGHQRRLSREYLARVRLAAHKLANEIATATSFDHLHSVVKKCCGPTAELLAYDVADRLGRFLGLRPEHVYLHCGTADGAKVLGVGGKRAALDAFPLPIGKRLSAAQAEDFLCVFKKRLPQVIKQP